MNTMTAIKINDTRQPALTRAVINQTGRENLEDICRHGASGGFVGFTYYTDTEAFTEKHKALILARLKEDASEFGNDGILSLMQGFNCFKGMSQDEIAEGLYEPTSDHRTTVYNGLAWYAAEEIARELNPEL